jgi:hypothetical protein
VSRRALRRLAIAFACLSVVATPALVVVPALVLAHPLPGAPSCPVFPADNPWNRRVDRLPVARDSAQIIARIGLNSPVHPDFGSGLYNGEPIGIPYAVVSAKTPRVPVSFQYASESDRGPYPLPRGVPIEGGYGSTGDRHVIVVDRSSCLDYELFAAYPHDGGRRWTAGSGAIFNLRSDNLRPAGWTSADAAGLPILPGLLNYSQVQQAVRTGTPITHAIRMTAQVSRTAYIWPARHEAGSSNRIDLPPMGARFRLRLSFNVAGYCKNSAPYCADAKAVLVEMQHYGLILADNGSNWYFGGTAYPQWPSALVQLLKGIPARDFVAVNTSCLMVSPNSGEARAKPGCPIG